MPATRTRIGLALALLSACASNQQEPVSAAAAPPMSEAANLDRPAPAPAPVAAPIEQLDELEASLAAYEAQLAHNEDRLRAMGVRIAAAAPRADNDAAGDRFAPAPPPRSEDRERAARSEERAEASRPAKKAASKPSAAEPPPPSPSPRQPNGMGSTLDRSEAGKTAGPRDAAPSGGASKRKATESEAQGDRCVDLCDLASATCELESKICDLASRHVDEPRYAEVCLRAEDDCRAASEACTRCSP